MKNVLFIAVFVAVLIGIQAARYKSRELPPATQQSRENGFFSKITIEGTWEGDDEVDDKVELLKRLKKPLNEVGLPDDLFDSKESDPKKQVILGKAYLSQGYSLYDHDVAVEKYHFLILKLGNGEEVRQVSEAVYDSVRSFGVEYGVLYSHMHHEYRLVAVAEL